MLTQEKKKLTLRINAQLIEQAKQYAADSDTSVSKLVEAFFYELDRKKRASETTHSPLVHQLTGILPSDIDAKQVYGDYLMEKYGR